MSSPFQINVGFVRSGKLTNAGWHTGKFQDVVVENKILKRRIENEIEELETHKKKIATEKDIELMKCDDEIKSKNSQKCK